MSTPANPYEAPKSDITVNTGDSLLASPWLRLAAAIVDGIVLFPVNWLLGKSVFGMPDTAALVEAGKKGQDAVDALMPGRGMLLLSSTGHSA